jgi:hypothetical protein
LVSISGALAAHDDRYREWASRVGVQTGTLHNLVERSEAIAETDALSALLFGLTRDQLKHLFAEFHKGWDYKPRLEKVLEYYDQWKDKA